MVDKFNMTATQYEQNKKEEMHHMGKLKLLYDIGIYALLGKFKVPLIFFHSSSKAIRRGCLVWAAKKGAKTRDSTAMTLMRMFTNTDSIPGDSSSISHKLSVLLPLF